jgi:squalene-hopene/tetraprenyl-beta-curcumene cyclase
MTNLRFVSSLWQDPSLAERRLRRVRVRSLVVDLLALVAWFVPWASAQQPAALPSAWDARAAAAYLDARQDWWLTWPTAARDHETSCVSCHTALPYALARPALRATLRQPAVAAPERRLVDNVVKRVSLWKEVEPFYPDQTRGLPKTSESRGTEAILNALIVATRDEQSGAISDDARAAFDILWALQFKNGELAGGWAWLNFHYEPWESSDAAYFGAALAAVAVGTEPGSYAASPEIQNHLTALREYLQRGAPKQTLFNRVLLLWASSRLPGTLSVGERQQIVDTLFAKQQADGGWSLAALGQWKRLDATAIDSASDGYATGLVAYALEHAGVLPTEPRLARALDWLVHHQDATTGMWTASSLNKQRDPTSDTGKFMSDAATAYAVLALMKARAPASP